MTGSATESKSSKTAARLREMILSGQVEAGSSVGSEAELQARCHVSRPTLRQAIRILEEEQLIEVRKGPNGGFFARVPSAEAVAHVGSIYLRSRGTTAGELSVAFGAMIQEVVRRAASHASVVSRMSLLEWVGVEQIRPGNWKPEVFLAYHLEFDERVSALAENRPLALFMSMLRDVGPYPARRELGVDEAHALIAETRKYHRLVAAAIANGDETAAAEATDAWLSWSRVVIAVAEDAQTRKTSPARG